MLSNAERIAEIIQQDNRLISQLSELNSKVSELNSKVKAWQDKNISIAFMSLVHDRADVLDCIGRNYCEIKTLRKLEADK